MPDPDEAMPTERAVALDRDEPGRPPGDAADDAAAPDRPRSPVGRRLARPAPQPGLHRSRRPAHRLPGRSSRSVPAAVHLRPTPQRCDLLQGRSAGCPARRTGSATTSRAATSTPAPSTAPAPRSGRRLRHARRTRSLVGLVLGCLAGFFGGGSDAILVPDHRHLLRHPAPARRPRVPVRVPQRREHAVLVVVGRSSSCCLSAGPDRPDHALRGHHRQAAATTSQAARALGAEPRPDHAAAHPAERDRPGDRRRHHRARHVHRRRGDAVASSASACSPPTVSWGIDISDAPVALRRRPAHAAVPRPVPDPDRAGVHHARRRGARRPRPEAALSGKTHR